MKVIWTNKAVEKLENYFDFIASDNPSSARKWFEEILDSSKKISSFPEIGRMVPEVKRENIREIIKGNYRLIYKVDKKQISILTIRHTSQQLNKIENIR